MATKIFSGKLDRPIDEMSAGGDKMYFYPLDTVGNVIESSASVMEIDEDGYYDITLAYNNYSVYYYSDVSKRKTNVGTVTVASDTVVTTIPNLLGSSTPVTPESELIIQQYLVEAEQAVTDSQAAQASAESAQAQTEAARDEVLNRVASYEVESTEYLINTFDSSDLPTGTVVKTLGYYTAGDGGGAEWVKTGDTGTASQSPSDIDAGELTSSNGDVFNFSGSECFAFQLGGSLSASINLSNDKKIPIYSNETNVNHENLIFKEIQKGSASVDGSAVYTAHKLLSTILSENSGTSSGEDNESAYLIQSEIPRLTTNGSNSFEKKSLLIQTKTGAEAFIDSAKKDSVGMTCQVKDADVLNRGAMWAAVFQGILNDPIGNGNDAVVNGIEVNVINKGSDEVDPFSVASGGNPKRGVYIPIKYNGEGSDNGTAAIAITSESGLAWHHGLAFNTNSIDTTALWVKNKFNISSEGRLKFGAGDDGNSQASYPDIIKAVYDANVTINIETSNIDGSNEAINRYIVTSQKEYRVGVSGVDKSFHIAENSGSINSNAMMTFDPSSDSNNPLKVKVGGVVKKVTEGDADSGGSGYKLLRVEN